MSGESVIIGVIISLTGNALISVSLILQKLAHNMIKKERDGNGNGRFAVHHVIGSGSSSVDEIHRWEQEDGEIRTKRPFWKRPIWWLGFVTMFLGEAGNIFAYGFAPASIIAPLGTISLVLNAIIAPFYLKEKFGIKDTIGILLATTGTFLIVFFTAEYGASQTVRSMEDITALFTRLGVLIYFFCSIPIIIALTVASKRLGNRFVMIDILLISLYGSYTIVSIKAITEIVKCSFSALWTHLISYVMLFIFVATAALQLRYLNLALERFESTLVIPLQFVFFNISTITSASLIFDDFKYIPSFNISMFCLGCLLDFLGVYLIASSRQTSSRHVSAEVDPLQFSEDDLLLGGSETTYFSYARVNNRSATPTSELDHRLKRSSLHSLQSALTVIASSVGTRHSSVFYHIFSPHATNNDSNEDAKG